MIPSALKRFMEKSGGPDSSGSFSEVVSDVDGLVGSGVCGVVGSGLDSGVGGIIGSVLGRGVGVVVRSGLD